MDAGDVARGATDFTTVALTENDKRRCEASDSGGSPHGVIGGEKADLVANA